MNSKLTLKLNKNVIEEAKIYASSRKRSLSSIVEDFLRSITLRENVQADDPEISPFVKSMSTGVIIPAELDVKTAHREFLKEKHK